MVKWSVMNNATLKAN